MTYQKIKRRIYEILDKARPGDIVSRLFDLSIMTLIVINILAIFIETFAIPHSLNLFLENFEILEPNAYETKEKLGDLSGDHNCNFFTNDSVANRTRVLVLADSYVNHYILDELSESFYELVCIHADRTADFATIIETYQPDIVIHENAERADRYHIVTQTAQTLCP